MKAAGVSVNQQRRSSCGFVEYAAVEYQVWLVDQIEDGGEALSVMRSAAEILD